MAWTADVLVVTGSPGSLIHAIGGDGNHNSGTHLGPPGTVSRCKGQRRIRVADCGGVAPLCPSHCSLCQQIADNVRVCPSKWMVCL
jgi:hypothetical protein